MTLERYHLALAERGIHTMWSRSKLMDRSNP